MTQATCKRPASDGKSRCACHEQMGNDFYFLPADRCLFENDRLGVGAAAAKQLRAMFSRPVKEGAR